MDLLYLQQQSIMIKKMADELEKKRKEARDIEIKKELERYQNDYFTRLENTASNTHEKTMSDTQAKTMSNTLTKTNNKTTNKIVHKTNSKISTPADIINKIIDEEDPKSEQIQISQPSAQQQLSLSTVQLTPNLLSYQTDPNIIIHQQIYQKQLQQQKQLLDTSPKQPDNDNISSIQSQTDMPTKMSIEDMLYKNELDKDFMDKVKELSIIEEDIINIKRILREKMKSKKRLLLPIQAYMEGNNLNEKSTSVGKIKLKRTNKKSTMNEDLIKNLCYEYFHKENNLKKSESNKFAEGISKYIMTNRGTIEKVSVKYSK